MKFEVAVDGKSTIGWISREQLIGIFIKNNIEATKAYQSRRQASCMQHHKATVDCRWNRSIVTVVGTCHGCHSNVSWGSVRLDDCHRNDRYYSASSCFRGKSSKLCLCFRVSEPSESLTYQLTGWNVSPACLVMMPSFPL